MSPKPDLSDRLVRAALELLRDRPAEQLSVREVAQRVGVSHQAPYVHFGDRRGFLAAIAGVGLEEAATAAAAAVSAAGPDPARRLHALVDAYVSFIDDSPHVHDLVYGPVVAMADHPRLQAAAIRYWRLLEQTVTANQPPGVCPAEALRRCATLWGTVYGIAHLDKANKIPASVDAGRTRLLHDAVEALRDAWWADGHRGSASDRR
jgi:AcrR family transcriptional regulator